MGTLQLSTCNRVGLQNKCTINKKLWIQLSLNISMQSTMIFCFQISFCKWRPLQLAIANKATAYCIGTNNQVWHEGQIRAFCQEGQTEELLGSKFACHIVRPFLKVKSSLKSHQLGKLETQVTPKKLFRHFTSRVPNDVLQKPYNHICTMYAT